MIKKSMDFLGTLVIGSAAMGMVGASNMSQGLKDTTNTLIGVGILSKGVDMFKWK
jgi:hypothetical protein